MGHVLNDRHSIFLIGAFHPDNNDIAGILFKGQPDPVRNFIATRDATENINKRKLLHCRL